MPAFAASQVGPFDQWPIGMGFEYFYGFVGGDANQWQPNLFRNTTQIYPVRRQARAGTWSPRMADDAIDCMTSHQPDRPEQAVLHQVRARRHARAASPDQGMGGEDQRHAPVRRGLEQAARADLREPEAARRDPAGREAGALAEGHAQGVGPAARAEEKKLFIRQVEVFAAYAAYNDHEIGRVIQAFEDMGKLDNTLIIYINGDNGTSAEGGPLGTPNEVAFFNGVNMMPGRRADEVATTSGAPSRPTTTCRPAGRGPSTRRSPGSSRTPRSSAASARAWCVSWPARIKDKGGLREQFMHVIDVVPTILEVAGIPAPEIVDGIKQAPIEGTSFAYTFDAKNAKAPSRHKTQYFEMMGQWALYHDGWLLSTKVNRAPWEAFGPANPDPLNNQVLELYDLNKDFSQSEDLAAKNPDKVKETEGDVHRGGRRSIRSSRWTPRSRHASSRRARTSPPAAPSSSTRGR